MIRISKYKYWTKINSNKNISDIYKSTKKFRNSVGALIITDNNNKIIEKQEFTQYYSQKLSSKPKLITKTINTLKELPILKKDILTSLNEQITKEEIESVTRQLKIKKAPGLDGVTNTMIIQGGEQMKNFLYTFFGKVWVENIYPSNWNKALVIPIPKIKLVKIDKNNIRPISLLSTTSKIFEKIIMNQDLNAC